MGLFDRLSRLFRSNLTDLVNKAEDPVKILEQSLLDMQEELVKLRQAVAMAIASQKRLQNKADQAQDQSKKWYERAELALRKGDENLAKEALIQRKTFEQSYISLNSQFQSQDGQVEKLKRCLVAIERKIAEAKTKKDMLKARAQAAKAQKNLQTAVGEIGINSASAAFERMEEKVEELEASSQAASELAGSDLESKFATLEGNADIEDELNELRRNLKYGVEAVALPPSEESDEIESNFESVKEVEAVKVSEVQSDFDELKRTIENS